MSVIDYNGEQNYGLTVFDRPKETIKETIDKVKKIEGKEDGAERQKLIKELSKDNHKRMFMGKTSHGEISVRMNDSEGRERIRMLIDKNDNPKLEFLNSKGEVTYSLPPEE